MGDGRDHLMFFKFTYYQQNVCWVQVAKMVREGYTHDIAIDLIYAVMGRIVQLLRF